MVHRSAVQKTFQLTPMGPDALITVRQFQKIKTLTGELFYGYCN